MRVAQQLGRDAAAPARPRPRAASRPARCRCGCRGGRCACPPPWCSRRTPRSARRWRSCGRRRAASPAPRGRAAPGRHAARSAAATARRRCAPCPATGRSSGCAAPRPRRPERTIASGVAASAKSASVARFTDDVGGLRRQHHGDQQGERIDESQFAARIGIGRGQRLEEAAHLLARHGARLAGRRLGGAVQRPDDWRASCRAHRRVCRRRQDRAPSMARARMSAAARRHPVRGGDRAAPQPVAARAGDPHGVICGLSRPGRAALLADRRLAGGRASPWSRSALALVPAAAERAAGRAAASCAAVRGRPAHRAHRRARPAAGARAAGRLAQRACWRSRPAGCRAAAGQRADARGDRDSLGEAEKRDLSAALRDALHRCAARVFDNPQLRDD